MPVKKKQKVFRIFLHRGKLAPVLVGVRAAVNDVTALKDYRRENKARLVPGNAGRLDCGHKSISVKYKVVAV